MFEHTYPEAEKDVGAANLLLLQFPFETVLMPALEVVCLVHARLFEHAPREEGRIPGQIKQDKTCIPLGNSQFLHHCLPENVEAEYREFSREMKELRQQLGGLRVSPSDQAVKIRKLQYVASFHARFLYIHPFPDGNGRVSRALALFQLFQLCKNDVAEWPVLNYSKRDFGMTSTDPMQPVSSIHTDNYYKAALRRAGENLAYLVHYFNLFFPELDSSIPAHILPPAGQVQDLRSSA